MTLLYGPGASSARNNDSLYEVASPEDPEALEWCAQSSTIYQADASIALSAPSIFSTLLYVSGKCLPASIFSPTPYVLCKAFSNNHSDRPISHSMWPEI